MAKLLQGALANTVVIVVFIILDALAVMLRLIAKRRAKHHFKYDDGWLIFALALFFIWAGLVIHCKFEGQIWVACSSPHGGSLFASGFSGSSLSV